MAEADKRTIRCAIYTRKSTEDGLEQAFNSLDAQREACEAYIVSQRHEGWTLVPGRYDDGGFSGGTMDRPGMKQLLQDVEDGKIDAIVVYKVDRLTRSLADFAKIVEILDNRKASFVSITQSFNTTTSMGRLTLNVLLSFAQFEREVTGERIRDKIAASKKKGMWMGGPVPLGYVVEERKLVVHPEEAQRVRFIMRRYLQSNSANELIAQLEAEGILTKIQERSSGPHRGGIPFRRGSLFHLLKNPIYRGMIVHKGEIYPGEHEPIVDEKLWDEVQDRLAAKAPPRKRSSNGVQSAMLRDMLTDANGHPMVPTYAVKGLRRYRYYETRRDLVGDAPSPATRYAMHQLDSHILAGLGDLLGDQHALRRISGIGDGQALQMIFDRAKHFHDALGQHQGGKPTVRQLLRRVRIDRNNLHLRLDPAAFGIENAVDQSWQIELPLPTKRPMREAKLVLAAAGQHHTDRDDRLIALLGEARDAQRLVMRTPEMPLHQIAKREGRCRKQLTRLLMLNWISPRIVQAIVEGRQPASLTRQKLMAIDLPMTWSEQERLLGL